jgi:Reverse transcriptase (RNA-dependent DNA polymerase)
MTVDFRNFEFSYDNPNGKPVFVPSERGRRIGCELKECLEAKVTFEPIFYHLVKGGHVAAIHAHRKNTFFAKMDLRNFFYSIGRNRVARVLYEAGVSKARHYAKWSCVKNPFDSPAYALPYGFVQSPILATLALRESALGRLALQLAHVVTISIYLDDIVASSNNSDLLEQTFSRLLLATTESNFQINERKTVSPTSEMTLFNCELTYGRTAVTAERRSEFYSVERTDASVAGFEKYCEVVERGDLSKTGE